MTGASSSVMISATSNAFMVISSGASIINSAGVLTSVYTSTVSGSRLTAAGVLT
jgi:hypothetical protein